MSTEAFTQHLKDTGLWPVFKARRQALEMHGADKKESWIRAADDYGFKDFTGQAATGRSGGKAPSGPIEGAAADVFAGKTSSRCTSISPWRMSSRQTPHPPAHGDCSNSLGMIQGRSTLSG